MKELQQRRQLILDMMALPGDPGDDRKQQAAGIKVLVGFEEGQTGRFLQYVLRVVDEAIWADTMRRFDEAQED